MIESYKPDHGVQGQFKTAASQNDIELELTDSKESSKPGKNQMVFKLIETL